MKKKNLYLGLSLLLCGMLGSSCAQRETPPAPKSLLETLPEIVANVNGEVITRQQVIERFHQARNMMGHQEHTAQAAQAETKPDASGATTAAHQAHQMAQNQPSSSASRGAEANGAAQPLDPLEERTLLRHIINA